MQAWSREESRPETWKKGDDTERPNATEDVCKIELIERNDHLKLMKFVALMLFQAAVPRYHNANNYVFGRVSSSSAHTLNRKCLMLSQILWYKLGGNPVCINLRKSAYYVMA